MSDEKQEQCVPELHRDLPDRRSAWDRLYDELQAVTAERDRLATELRVEREEHERMRRSANDEHDRINTERWKLVAENERLRADPASTIRLAHEQRDRALAEAREAEARLRDAVVLTREEREAIETLLYALDHAFGDGPAHDFIDCEYAAWVSCGRPLLGGGEESGE